MCSATVSFPIRIYCYGGTTGAFRSANKRTDPSVVLFVSTTHQGRRIFFQKTNTSTKIFTREKAFKILKKTFDFCLISFLFSRSINLPFFFLRISIQKLPHALFDFFGAIYFARASFILVYGISISKHTLPSIAISLPTGLS